MAEIVGWGTTENGVHYPIMKGQSNVEAMNSFFNSKHGKAVARLSSKKYNEAEINNALTRFTSSQGYENIRKASNGEKVFENHLDIANRKVDKIDVTNRYKQYANAIEQYIHQSPKYDGMIYRGIRFNDKDGKAYISQLKKGNLIDMKGISSWSSKENIAIAFTEKEKSKNYRIVFTTKNKTGVSISDKSISTSEFEILHSSKSKFKVLNVDEYIQKNIHSFKVKLEEL